MMAVEYESVECERCGRSHYRMAWCECVPQAKIDAYNRSIGAFGKAAIPPPAAEAAHDLAGSGEPEGGANQSFSNPRSLADYLSELREGEWVAPGIHLDLIVVRDALDVRGAGRSIAEAQADLDVVRARYDALDSRSPVTESKRGEGR